MYPRYKDRVTTKKYSTSNKKGHGHGWELRNNRGTVIARSWPTIYSNAENARRAAGDTAENFRRWALANDVVPQAKKEVISAPSNEITHGSIDIEVATDNLVKALRSDDEMHLSHLDDSAMTHSAYRVTKVDVSDTPKRNKLLRILRRSK